MVAVIAVGLFFSPATRALADTIIRQFGAYIFVQGTPQPDLVKIEMAGQQDAESPEQKATLQAYKQQLNEQMKKRAQANNDVTASFAPDAAAASQLAGFTVLAPAYLPDGYTLGEVKHVSGGWAVTQDDGDVAALISYTDQTTDSFFTIEELKVQPGKSRTVERPEIKDVTVRGQSGVWMPGLDGGKNALVWDENGITYSVVSNNLSLDESAKIAESLGK